ncbi:hypothetical protein FACHB389_19430, partial [Nostoc calcicola FACHB-389]
MLLTKDRNSNNENIGIKTSNTSIKIPDIFNDSNNYFGSSVTGVNSFRASDRSSYTPGEVYTSAVENKAYNYVNNSNESNKSVTQANAVAAAVQPDLIIQNAVNPSVGSVGGSIQISYQVKNQGTGSAGYNYTYFYLSKDQTLSDEDSYLGYDF